jgi:hypothetical protein
MKLLLSQKNELYKIIEDTQSLSPNQFSIIEPKNDREGDISILLKNTDFVFKIFEDKRYHKSFFLNFIPGIDVYKEITGNVGWDEIIQNFYFWLENIVRELQEPDYWERFEHELSVANINSNINNSKFSIKEYEDLQRKIDLISQNIETIPLIAEQLSDIKKELNRLTELAKDLGKYDWFNLFVGSIISIAIQLSISKENVSLLWDIIKSAFNNLFLK